MNSGVNVPTLRRSGEDDWDDVRSLLLDAGLPVDDLDRDMLDDFLIAESGPSIVGIVGLQVYDTVGLLRSLVVASEVDAVDAGATELTWIGDVGNERREECAVVEDSRPCRHFLRGLELQHPVQLTDDL